MSNPTETLKTLAAADKHRALGAKMVPFAGYEMPLQYAGLNEEHLTVRAGVGVFDVSHMGEFYLRGEKALELIQKVTSNDASKLTDGKIQYSCLPNETGGIVDDLLVYRISETEYMLVVNASNMDKDWKWIEERNTFGVEMENRSEGMSLFAVQGPKAVAAIESLTDMDLAGMTYYTFEQGKFGGVNDVLVSATGYTGAGGFEIYVANEYAEEVLNKILEAGAAEGIKPIGLAARDTLRLEMGFCLYGNDIDEKTSPLEAGLGWITKFTKDFTNHKNLKAQKEAGVTRRLVGFEMQERGIPRQGYMIVDKDGQEIGHVTSGTQSPSLSKGIGMGYIAKPFASADSEVYIAIRNKQIMAKVVKLPFYKG